MPSQKDRYYEEYAYVLDYLPEGRYDISSRRREPIIQAIGETYFTLLELIARPSANISIGERLYIGRGVRLKVAHVKGKIKYSDLTATAKSELLAVLEKIIRKNEKFFVDFFNNAGPITTRLHALELLPGIGKKLMWEIIEERKRRPFSSFEDIASRVPTSDPIRLIIKRIELELKGNEKYNLFIKKERSE